MSHDSFQALTVQMARRQAHYLLRDPARLDPESAVPNATRLIRDCVSHLNQPRLAVDLVLGFHAAVERWSAWPPWIKALDLVLALDAQYFTATTKIQLLNARIQAAREVGDFQRAVSSATEALRLAEALGDRRARAAGKAQSN